MKTLQEKLIQTRRNEELAINKAFEMLIMNTADLKDKEERLAALTNIAVRLTLQEKLNIELPIESEVLRMIIPFFVLGITIVDRKIIEQAIEQND